MDNLGRIFTLKTLQLCGFCHLPMPRNWNLDSKSSFERKKKKKPKQLSYHSLFHNNRCISQQRLWTSLRVEGISPHRKNRFHPEVGHTCRLKSTTGWPLNFLRFASLLNTLHQINAPRGFIWQHKPIQVKHHVWLGQCSCFVQATQRNAHLEGTCMDGMSSWAEAPGYTSRLQSGADAAHPINVSSFPTWLP